MCVCVCVCISAHAHVCVAVYLVHVAASAPGFSMFHSGEKKPRDQRMREEQGVAGRERTEKRGRIRREGAAMSKETCRYRKKLRNEIFKEAYTRHLQK